jgi:hypothetical protein
MQGFNLLFMDVIKVKSSTYCKAMLGGMLSIEGTNFMKKLSKSNFMNKIDTWKWLLI